MDDVNVVNYTVAQLEEMLKAAKDRERTHTLRLNDEERDIVQEALADYTYDALGPGVDVANEIRERL